MTFPSDSVLIARGKYSTLSRERREQVQRVQKICDNVLHLNNQVLRDCQEQPPTNAALIPSLSKCVENLNAARTIIEGLCNEMAEIRPLAWEGAEE